MNHSTISMHHAEHMVELPQPISSKKTQSRLKTGLNSLFLSTLFVLPCAAHAAVYMCSINGVRSYGDACYSVPKILVHTQSTAPISPTPVTTTTTPIPTTTATPSASAPTSNANAHFVSTNGNDSNPGTIALPWRSIHYSVQQLRAGDTLYARGGVYAETVIVGHSGTASSPITITAYPGETPIIDGAGLTLRPWSALLSLQGNYIIASGFELRNINMNGLTEGGYGADLSGIHDTVEHMNVHHTWSQGIIAHGDNDIIQTSTISYVSMLNCRTCAVHGQFAGSPSCVSAAKPYGSGTIVHNAVIQNNTVYNCWGEGISTWLADGTVIQDNISYDNFSVNLYVNNARNVVVQRNLVYNSPNNPNHYANVQHGAFTLADEVIPSNDLIHSSSNNSVVNNMIYNAEFCMFCWTSVANTGLRNVLIANNTIVGNFSTADLQTSSGRVVNNSSLIFNNIVTGNVFIPSSTGLNISHNLWGTTPQMSIQGTGNMVRAPLLAGTTAGRIPSHGQLTADYFRVLSSSPALRAGTAVSSVTTDFFMTPRSPTPSIGATEL